MSVDGGVHLLTRFRDGYSFAATVREVGSAVTGSILTTVFGFGSMVLADHHGLKSFGQFAIVGLACNWAATMIGFTSLLALRRTVLAAPGDADK
jgi:predicted RND superfamily exporter protein